jgi:integrase
LVVRTASIVLRTRNDSNELPAIRLHDARRRACSLLLAGGVPIEVVQATLGHANPDVTRRVYKHILRKITAKQVEKASKLLTRHRAKRQRGVSNP